MNLFLTLMIMDEKISSEQCPHCGSIMETGYIITLMGIMTWQKSKKFDLKAEKIFSAKIGPKGTFHEAIRCKQCKYIQFNY